jgi:hypothetical protein
MELIVKSSDLTQTKEGFAAEASEIGIKPGCWPETLVVDDSAYELIGSEMEYGQLVLVHYYNGRNKKRISIFND